jgi:hypothetical protein
MVGICQSKQKTYDGTTTGIANHKVLTGFQVMKIGKMCTVDGSRLRFADEFGLSKIDKDMKKVLNRT